MKYCLFILSILLLSSCQSKTDDSKNDSSKTGLVESIQGSWKGYKGEPVWDITHDSIYYHTEDKSYYYFIHNNDMIVLYKNGVYAFKNVRVANDTFFFKTGDINAVAFRSKNKTAGIAEGGESDSENDPGNGVMNNIAGQWGYKPERGFFKWVFAKDSIFYVQLNKKYFYKKHGHDIIVLTDEDPIIMKNLIVKEDTMSFTTEEGVFITAYKMD